MMARSTKRSNQRPDTLMQDRISPNSNKSSCNARPDHTLGPKQAQRDRAAMSALPPKADIERHDWHVRFVPTADLCTATSPCHECIRAPLVILSTSFLS